MITFVHYHQTTLEQFSNHLQYYKKHYNMMKLETLAYDRPLPPKPLFITFDDGWADSYELYPVFQTIPGIVTIFLTVRFIDSYINPRTKIEGDRYYTLTSAQIREMSGVVNFQSHGLTHRDITRLSIIEARRELADSKQYIEELTGNPVYAYAYPYNKVNDEIRTLLSNCGYRLARMGERMLNKIDADRYTLKSVGVPQVCSTNELSYRLLKARVKTFLRGHNVC